MSPCVIALFAMLLCAAPAWATISFVAGTTAHNGDANGSSQTSLVLLTPGGTSANEVMIACIGDFSNVVPSSIPSPFAYATGSQSTSCAMNSGLSGGVCAYVGVYSSGSSFTWSWGSGTNYPSGVLLTYANVVTSTPVDSGTGSATGTGATVSASYGNTSVSNDWLVTCFGGYPGGWSTTPGGETQRENQASSGGSYVQTWAGDQALGSAPASGTISGTLTAGGQNGWGLINVPIEPNVVSSTQQGFFIFLP
jgi:hypothetical protein